MSLNEAAWSEVRHAYLAGGETVAAIAARYGISEGAIYRRARRDGWAKRKSKTTTKLNQQGKPDQSAANQQQSPKHVPTKTDNHKPKTKKKKATGKSKSPATKAELIERLYDAIDAKLGRLENRWQDAEEISAAESERETRELGSMIRSFEKVAAFAKTLQGRIDKQRKTPVVDAGDAERMREEIAQRLERLCAQEEAQDKPGTAER
ncbi:MAG: hypothetical protein K0U74_02585 [Alphaproteobacteria bacterium]|nr:hypothetical protein [Alphaproteobacteria bacterium]